MPTDVLNPRRAPRLQLRCKVEVHDRFSSWFAETEDLGPRGCQLVTPRLASRGRDLQLTIRCEPLGRTIRAAATVVWSRSRLPTRQGLELEVARTDLGWFEAILQADPSMALKLRRAVDRLPRNATLHLGVPPRTFGDFSAEEVAILRRIGDGRSVDELSRRLGSAFERVRGALFGLVARRLLVLAPGEGAEPNRWRALLAAAEKSLAAEGIHLPAPTPSGPLGAPGRSAAAQALYDVGIGHLTAGRIEVAVTRLREAQALAPADPLIAGALGRLAPWASDSPGGAAAVAPPGLARSRSGGGRAG